jgi:RNA polymerase sigma-70 factor (ECF subfamily)
LHLCYSFYKKQEQKINLDLEKIISLCKNHDPKAQRHLYNEYSGLLFSVVKRYLKNEEDAEDALIEGFYKILSKIKSFKGDGSFEGWMRRIVVNECLMKLRKKRNFTLALEEAYSVGEAEMITPNLAYQDLLKVLENLPTGYRTIFNLYEIEGFKHREIAEQLGISINTSKSQLILAKKRIRDLIKKKQLIERAG